VGCNGKRQGQIFLVRGNTNRMKSEWEEKMAAEIMTADRL